VWLLDKVELKALRSLLPGYLKGSDYSAEGGSLRKARGGGI
jgi:hypothetical protein